MMGLSAIQQLLNIVNYPSTSRRLNPKTDTDGILLVPVLVRFVVITVLNLWVLLTVIYYQRRGRKSEKED